ncbi:hypothetical protein llg_27350 [Luteolibacter sp. LG18]|nr:hypothetical protein llg_27350 [Luteolibacter sp. LG18]
MPCDHHAGGAAVASMAGISTPMEAARSVRLRKNVKREPYMGRRGREVGGKTGGPPDIGSGGMGGIRRWLRDHS